MSVFLSGFLTNQNLVNSFNLYLYCVFFQTGILWLNYIIVYRMLEFAVLKIFHWLNFPLSGVTFYANIVLNRKLWTSATLILYMSVRCWQWPSAITQNGSNVSGFNQCQYSISIYANKIKKYISILLNMTKSKHKNKQRYNKHLILIRLTELKVIIFWWLE
jgi:hypothetical protein